MHTKCCYAAQFSDARPTGGRPTVRRHAARFALAACAVGWLAAATCQAAVRVEAYVGGPLGVGRITVDLPPDAPSVPWGDDRFALADEHQRLLYPVIADQPVRRMVRQFLGLQSPWRATFYFLFRGTEPLDVTVYTPWPQPVRVVPERDREDYDELMDDWWEATTDRFQQVHREAEYPIVVQNYVTANWARRLGRRMPEPELFLLGQRRLGATWLAQLTANEGYQAAIERELVLGRSGAGEPASLSMPTPVVPLPFSFNLPARRVNVEPIAEHVPLECFYLRFGSFENYLWFRDFLHRWQGDLGNMVVLRSIDRGTSQRLQEQIALRESKIARVMGPKVIRDVAIIGLDAYLRDGAAMGILFQANNSDLLSLNINGQRRDAMEKYNRDAANTFSRDAQRSAMGGWGRASGEPPAFSRDAQRSASAATLTTVKIADHDVSYLSTPDGRLRSYYATDGDFHLVSTSRRLVERFYAAGLGHGALAAASQFQMARYQVPLERNDTIFLYLSSAFFENLASPPYRVELDRRLRSVGEMRVLKMARLAALAEGTPARSIDELVAAELLPAGFGQRADGSALVESEAGFHDSLRGVPGWLVPIPDVPVESITPTEAARYEQFQQLIDQQVGRFVPVVAAITREPLGDSGLDQITTDVRLGPYSQTRLAKWANMLGPAQTLRVAPIEGDVASAEVVWPGLGEPIHLFGGLRDFRTPLVVREGAAAPSPVPAEYVRGYIGAWPRPHLLDRWLGAPSGPPDPDGNVRYGLFNLWHRRTDDFFLFSFKRDVLMEVGPQLAMIEAERPAQIRVRVDDPSDRQVATALSGLGYMRAQQTSASGSRFMNSLTSQLHVPPPDCRDVAEQLVGGRFVCPLGGEYVLVDAAGGFSRDAQRSAHSGGLLLWASTATTPANQFLLTEIPADYVMPLVEWFRGADAEVARFNDALSLHAELEMVHQDVGPPADESGGGLSLPGIGDLLNGWTKPNDETEELPPPELDLPPPANQADEQ